MKPSLTDKLCTRCGLCCDGSLFADVELAGTDEASGLEVMGLEIEDVDEKEGGLLLQPCRALKGKRCSIYPHRPDCCRIFECRLLQEVKRGEVGVDRAKAKIAEALQRIDRVKELVVELGQRDDYLPLKERCVEALALSAEVAADPELNSKRAELQAAMISVESLIQETFLGGR
ncbi:MAG: YkgJ family cysteine cluster protein [Verrucomicrobia bacterium]|nr:YkgJ family cysteine cluster protein [Verrucomicrobiota bacterium]